MKVASSALLAIASAAALSTSASAHVVAAPDTARAGSYAVVAFRVGHACAVGDVTTRLRIEIPAGVASARPQPKPGWTYALERPADPKAAPTAVIFSGRLPDEAFDDFALLMKLPATGERLVFPVVQTCERGESRWTDLPDPAKPDAKLARPAPILILTPADAAPAAHQH